MTTSTRSFDDSSKARGVRGYALVGLLALMTVLMIAAAAAAPSASHQAQRERELEAIARGEEVAEAIRQFVRLKGALPTSMDELLEGAPRGTKKVQVLRASAARDPLSESGEWRLVKENDPKLVEFQREVVTYADGQNVLTTDPLFAKYNATFTRVVNLKTDGDDDSSSGGEDDSSNTSGPFLGVASRSRRDSIVAYYGIERHTDWVFTPLFK